MQIGKTRVIIRPALLMIFAGGIVGLAGIAAAGWYALGTQHTYGMANPKRWTFGVQQPTRATLTMLTPAGQKEIIATRTGYSNLNFDEGISITVHQVGTASSGVYIRNTIDVDKSAVKNDLTFQFDATAANAFPIVFTIRDASIKSGGGLLWSQKFTVAGDWKTYKSTVPMSSVGQGKVQFMVLAGHLGEQTGSVSIRDLYLK